MPSSHGQPSARSRSGGVLVTRVTTRPMNQGTVLSPSATSNSTTNKAANSHLAWRAKCHKKASRLGGGSGCSGAAVGLRIRSNRDNIFVGYGRAWFRSIRLASIRRPSIGLHKKVRFTTGLLTFSPSTARVIVPRSQKMSHAGKRDEGEEHDRPASCRRIDRAHRRRGAGCGRELPVAASDND